MAPRRKVAPLQLLTAPLRLALFDPRVTAPLLVALLYYPEKLQSLLPARLSQYVSSPALIRTLKAFLGLGVIRGISDKLSDLSLNNWTGAANFVKSQEVVLITGGASGIGALMAREFAGKGVKVIVMDLSEPSESFPSNVHFYSVDVTKSDQVSQAAEKIRAAHGHPTVLINNAGVGVGRTILTEPEAGIRKTFDVNIIAHFIMVKEFVPAMVERNHGHVVTVASTSSFVTPCQIVDYACTKVAAVAFHEGLSSELLARYKAPKVKTTIIHPNWIRTPLIKPLYTHPDFKDALLEPEEVSSVIVRQVLSGKSAQIILPKKLAAARAVRAFPMWLQNYVRGGQANTLALAGAEGLGAA